MNCDEYQRWFEVALRGPLPEECPLDDYRRHLVACPKCQLLLSFDDVAETIAQVARRSSVGEDPKEIDKTVRRVRKRARHAKAIFASSLSVGVAALLATGYGVRLTLRERAAPPVASSPQGTEVVVSPPPAPAETVTPEEFASSLLTEDYGLRFAKINRKANLLSLNFERKNPESDQYEWVKRVLLSGVEAKFPTIEAFIVYVIEEGENVLTVDVASKDLADLSDRDRELPGPAFCAKMGVFHDRDGLAKRPEGRE